jgi:hypothetical protein
METKKFDDESSHKYSDDWSQYQDDECDWEDSDEDRF